LDVECDAAPGQHPVPFLSIRQAAQVPVVCIAEPLPLFEYSMGTPKHPASAAEFLAEWHRIVREKDGGAVAGLLEDDITLGPPPYWTRLEGKELVAHLLGIILKTIEGFEYHREWVDGRELALEFTGRVGDKDLQGIDLVSLSPSHRIARLDVLMRPLNGIRALREAIAPQMQEFLLRRGSNDPR
jgi:hypothetical protein